MNPNASHSYRSRDDRHGARTAAAETATLTFRKGESAGGELTEISREGIRLRTSAALLVGEHVTVDLPEQARIDGWVVWAQGGQIGICLSEPLPPGQAPIR